MTDKNKSVPGAASGEKSTELAQALQATGLFEQLKTLETSLSGLAGDLATLGNAAVERSQETESLAAHLLALESIATVMLATHPVHPDRVREQVKTRTAEIAPDGKGAEQVQAVVDGIYRRAGVTAEQVQSE